MPATIGNVSFRLLYDTAVSVSYTHLDVYKRQVDELSESESYKGLFHQHKDGEPLPSAKVCLLYTSRAYRIPILEVAGYEADDVIGTLATEAGRQGITCLLYTSRCV